MSRPLSGDKQNQRVAAEADAGREPDNNTTFLYRGLEDDRPLLWRHPLNELVGALNDVNETFSYCDFLGLMIFELIFLNGRLNIVSLTVALAADVQAKEKTWPGPFEGCCC